MQTKAKMASIIAMLGMGSCVLIGCSGQAQAAQIEYGIGYNGIYSDNIYRTYADTQDEYISLLRGLFSYHEQTRRVTSLLDVEATGREFALGTYNNDVLFGVDSLTHVVILPKIFSLSERDMFTQVPIDPRFVMTPTNLQNTNALSVGPNFSWYMTDIDALKLHLRYQNFYYASVPTSNYRWLAHARFVHYFTRRTDLSLNFVPSNVLYRHTTLNPDYRRQDAYVGFATRLGLTSLTADAGRTRIAPNGSGNTMNGNLERITLLTEPSRHSRITLAGDRSYGDSGRYALLESPASNLVLPVATNPGQIVGGGLYYAKTATLNFSYLRPYGTDQAAVFVQRLNYLTAPLSQSLDGGAFSVGYDLSNRWTDSLFGDYVRVNYYEYHTDTRDFGGGMRVRYRLTPHLSVSLEGMYDRANSTDTALEYNEWRAIVGVSYLTNPRRMRSNPFVHFTNPVVW